MISIDFGAYTQYFAIATGVFFVLTIIAFIAKWGIRFRLFGVSSFMVVLTVGLFGLSLGLFKSTKIPGALRYTLVYDNGANQAVIALPPTVTPTEVQATLQQAAADLYSNGRLGLGDQAITIRARTVVHPQKGVSQPLYLGEARRSLSQKDAPPSIQIFSENFATIQQLGG